ncbi:MAG: glyoxalase [Burkholderiaceae bacterium]|nr:glyoxalase [Microbacteriaceae bacterium]
MANPVVHFEIAGPDPAQLRRYYGELFGWSAPAGSPVAPEVSQVDEYSFIEADVASPGIPGGIGGGAGRDPRAMFYVGVPDVEEALAEAERLGGTRVFGPAHNAAGGVVVGHFTDPAGNLIGVAGPA